ncbi:hypothetical protein HYC85_006432 [Camellia sinensis]|uniref:Ribosomal protein S4e central region domain-containing protein n=1 Tax=Camellia sinensis TaxID=4442 RepID=A0A7J7HNM0_CAMSI|nr:hypothetical protein HYC85_006432 [Camellia sinensis]
MVLVMRYAPKPSSGPHKSRECLPLILILHVVSIPKTNENFRLLYDTKGRFRLHSTRDEEAKSDALGLVLCSSSFAKFALFSLGRRVSHTSPVMMGRIFATLTPLSRPMIPSNLTETNKITDFIKFDVGNVVMVTGGNFDTIHVQDATGREFATRMGNVFTIGKGAKLWVSLPKGKGIKLSIIEEARKRACCPSSIKLNFVAANFVETLLVYIEVSN